MKPYKKNATTLVANFFPPIGTIFELIQDIIRTNRLTKFHDDRTMNMASRVLIRKNPPPLVASRVKNAPFPGGHVFQPTGIIFLTHRTTNVASRPYTEKCPAIIIETNLLTKFHEDWTINVASRPYKEKCPTPGGHVFKATKIILHEHRKINVASRENAPPLGSHVFQANTTIFKLIRDIIKTNLLIKFHKDWTINVSSSLLTMKNTPPPGGYVFEATETIFILITHPRYHWEKSSDQGNAPPPGGHVFQPTGIIFKLVQDIIGMNLLTRFHEDKAINVASIKNAPPLGSHTKLRTKFHEDWTINVASRVLIRQILTTHDALHTTDKR
ncbi:hypothetical protein DPMN_070707 [Dreissena polymorpha]|uniref:Uncharacterized protein n=1 Tax=Dreissena polymorpha TaxID=45954 RepID=A0A9D3Z5Y3_DREPO|nr:hypothetical protein DPMN_070707 [Dreissena polymorpha]